MANGDAALAAGMDVVSGDADRRNGYDEINKTRDYIATFSPDVIEVAKGGTGAQTASQARINLGLQSTVAAVANASATATEGQLLEGGSGGRINVADPTTPTNAATKRYVDGRPTGVPSTGGTFTGHVFFPNAFAATDGYTVAYINSDGRLARGASSERYKKFISDIDPTTLGDVWPEMVRYQMKGGDGTWKYGYIAERLAESDDQRPFVVFNADDQPDSIDFIALLMVQNAQLHQAVDLLTQRLDTLEQPGR